MDAFKGSRNKFEVNGRHEVSHGHSSTLGVNDRPGIIGAS